MKGDDMDDLMTVLFQNPKQLEKWTTMDSKDNRKNTARVKLRLYRPRPKNSLLSGHSVGIRWSWNMQTNP
jgi:hypothetical protein